MEHKLLIEPVFKLHARFFGIFLRKKIIQNQRFSYGVRIKNVGIQPFDGCKLKNILLTPVLKSYDIVHATQEEYSVKSLNPKESIIIWLDTAILNIDGSHWLKFEVRSLKEGDTITIYRWDSDNKCMGLPLKNRWSDSFFVYNEYVIQQKITNHLLVSLTLILLLEQIFGIRNILKFLLNHFLNLL